MLPGGHCWDYYPGTLSYIQNSIQFMGAWTKNDLQLFAFKTNMVPGN